MTGKLLFLFEHASGYALITIKGESLDELVSEFKASDEESIKGRVKLTAFHPFTSAINALEHCNSVSEGIIHEELNSFLKENCSCSKSSNLYVQERKLADAIRTELGSTLNKNCIFNQNSAEIFRILRVIFPSMIAQMSHFAESKAQIGLGHSYSRAKVKFNVNRADNMIIQTISLLDQIDKDINTFSMRVKEWFSYHFPELVKIVPDNANFVKVVGLICSRDGINEETIPKLHELLEDEDKVNTIVECAKTSCGFDISEDDLLNLNLFTKRICNLIARRKSTHEYLLFKMEGVAPNLKTLIGDQVAARLISHAGSLTNLAKFPASTIQILGAEKALFRALKTRSATPKYGIIFHSSFIGRASRENKGRISRFLAAKCALASRIDCFSDILCDVYGKHLQKQVEDRLEYFNTGVRPITNREAMDIAYNEANQIIRKLKKKALKTLQRAAQNGTTDAKIEEPVTTEKKKKKRKAENGSILEEDVKPNGDQEVDEEVKPKKKKVKKEEDTELDQVETTEAEPVKKKKKKKVKAEAMEE
ncbi:snoRNP complex protein nop56 [Cichlidogyrus casuarinus]|uniref:Nucleolar protein 56 n=1 Tax=Cichlidogyrus casuarinus TaxID=1844966 RepID=A0ABD2Q5V6_9PLAT